MPAGWEAAWIKRAGKDVLGVDPQSQIVGDDLKTLPISLARATRRVVDQPDTRPEWSAVGRGCATGSTLERSSLMSALGHIGPRPVLAAIGITVLAAF